MTAQRNLASEKLREIVATVLELEPSEVGESDPWVDELGMTSLEKLEAITRIQEAFGTPPDTAAGGGDRLGGRRARRPRPGGPRGRAGRPGRASGAEPDRRRRG
ncbi:acyl carrier protein [Streptomyces thermoviolaceus]|uniref:Acyl carrier protein n=2 Tax=Streptomyces thermoviolaceus TaxID=1952 RepID=A0ABX0YNN9_STRTL|nr:acyl carrier protein [Streptomyces thermoviolaceus subsp. thermoviolaceus]GGV65971.1 hypothetical protein GCM10010499_10700 [Streptomyces thermoviolaceus subsp. apingens]GHA75836.1 hypothetical protein GCM10010512_02810 [Streptomyces thermoviolaceus subsp. thermoviolaceus]